MRYRSNLAVLHTDAKLMPQRQAAWSAWNYVARKGGVGEVTYWMNRLQRLEGPLPISSRSIHPVRRGRRPSSPREAYEHPVFDLAAVAAQKATLVAFKAYAAPGFAAPTLGRDVMRTAYSPVWP